MLERSEYYWELLAERKRIALINTLEENKELDEKLKKSEDHGKKLEEEIDLFKEMVENTKALVTELAVYISKNISYLNVYIIL